MLGFSGSYSRISSEGDDINLVTANIDFSYFVND